MWVSCKSYIAAEVAHTNSSGHVCENRGVDYTWIFNAILLLECYGVKIEIFKLYGFYAFQMPWDGHDASIYSVRQAQSRH